MLLLTLPRKTNISNRHNRTPPPTYVHDMLPWTPNMSRLSMSNVGMLNAAASTTAKEPTSVKVLCTRSAFLRPSESSKYLELSAPIKPPTRNKQLVTAQAASVSRSTFRRTEVDILTHIYKQKKLLVLNVSCFIIIYSFSIADKSAPITAERLATLFDVVHTLVGRSVAKTLPKRVVSCGAIVR